jgi:ubiquinone/menaquinone biosynthesis C-methylase UbiE
VGVLLEIGAGGGRFTSLLLPRCQRLIAADTSPAMLELLRRRFGDDGRVERLLLDGRGLTGVPDGSLDAAFSYGVFVHIQHWDIYNYLVELRRTLRPGGRAIIQHANSFSELGWGKFLHDVPQSLGLHKQPNTFTVMTPDLMRELAGRAGLVLDDCVTDVVRRDCISLLRKPSP